MILLAEIINLINSVWIAEVGYPTIVGGKSFVTCTKIGIDFSQNLFLILTKII